MARGWASKSVEAQIESFETDTQVLQGRPSSAQIELLRQKENLALSRTRVLRELEVSKNPRYVLILKKSLMDLDRQLLKVDQDSSPLTRSS